MNQIETKFYTGESDLAAFTMAYSSSDTWNMISNTLKYKHVVGIKDGTEVAFVWFEDENAG